MYLSWHINIHRLFNAKVILSGRTVVMQFNPIAGGIKKVSYFSQGY